MPRALVMSVPAAIPCDTLVTALRTSSAARVLWGVTLTTSPHDRVARCQTDRHVDRQGGGWDENRIDGPGTQAQGRRAAPGRQRGGDASQPTPGLETAVQGSGAGAPGAEVPEGARRGEAGLPDAAAPGPPAADRLVGGPPVRLLGPSSHDWLLVFTAQMASSPMACGSWRGGRAGAGGERAGLDPVSGRGRRRGH